MFGKFPCLFQDAVRQVDFGPAYIGFFSCCTVHAIRMDSIVFMQIAPGESTVIRFYTGFRVWKYRNGFLIGMHEHLISELFYTNNTWHTWKFNVLYK